MIHELPLSKYWQGGNKALLTFHSLRFWNGNCQQYAGIEMELQQFFNQHGCLSRCFNIVWSLQTTTRCVEWGEILVLTICYYTDTLRFLKHILKYLYYCIHSQLQIIWRYNLKWWKLLKQSSSVKTVNICKENWNVTEETPRSYLQEQSFQFRKTKDLISPWFCSYWWPCMPGEHQQHYTKNWNWL